MYRGRVLHLRAAVVGDAARKEERSARAGAAEGAPASAQVHSRVVTQQQAGHKQAAQGAQQRHTRQHDNRSSRRDVLEVVHADVRLHKVA